MSSIKTFIKEAIGIEDGAKFKRDLYKRWAKLIYRKKYTAADVLHVMTQMGLKPSDVVFIHASMRAFFNYTGTAGELIAAIEDYIGPEGTLAMPAFPKDFWHLTPLCLTADYKGADSPVMFDVLNTPTGAGHLAETFRKMPGVSRSINLQHSVCARGRHAEYLVAEHHLSRTSWDEHSPYYKSVLLDAKIFSLGLDCFMPTIYHCVDSALFGKYEYFDQFFRRDITYNYRDADGNVGTHRMLTIDGLERQPDNKRVITQYYEEGQYKVQKLSNLTIAMVHARYSFDRLLELAKKGHVIYNVPSPKGYKWDA